MRSAEDRRGRLAGTLEESRSVFERAFDPASGRLQMPRRGRIWDAAGPYHRAGRRGAGRRVAIIDAGFDLTIRELQEGIDDRSVVRPESVEPNQHHGTVAALQVRAMAPDAELLLLDVSRGTGRSLHPEDVSRAIRTAAAAGVDAINLSLEFETDCEPRRADWAHPELWSEPAPPRDAFLAEVDAWIANAEPYVDARCRWHCAICDALGALSPTTFVAAAAGNDSPRACPACVAGVVGVGFHVTRTVERSGVTFSVSDVPDTISNLALAELVVEEPPGFDGTSFAAPLLTGLAVLLPEPAELAAMARLPRALTPVLGLANLHATSPAGSLPDDASATLHQGLVRFAEAIPAAHRHFEHAETRGPCGLCALTLIDWYDVFVSWAIARGEPELAVGLARIAAVLAPDVASVQANLARATIG